MQGSNFFRQRRRETKREREGGQSRSMRYSRKVVAQQRQCKNMEKSVPKAQ